MTTTKPVLLKLPAVDQKIRYAFAYWPLTLRNLLLPHRLRPDAARRYAAPIVITSQLREAWHALYQTPDQQQPVPYLYNQSVGTLMYLKIFRDLGINFQNVRHASHTVEHPLGTEAFATSNHQTIICAVDGCWKIDDRKVLIDLHTEVRSGENGQLLLASIIDSFVILRTAPSATERLPTIDRRKMLRLAAAAPRRKSTGPRPAPRAIVQFDAPHDLGRRYGKVSGDNNPVHTSRLASSLFGIPRPFMQGLCLRNAVIGALASHGTPAETLSMSFISPAILGQTFNIHIHNADFEVQDQAGVTVSLGKFSTPRADSSLMT